MADIKVEQVEIPCHVRMETEKAYLIFDGKRACWIPKSMITDEGMDPKGDDFSIFIPVWLATEKGLV